MENHDAVFKSTLYEIGRLTCAWTNTESLLVHVTAGLLGCDKDRALLVYLTLSTTRARIDLVERLAKSPFTPAAQRKAVLDVTARLAKLSAERNYYSHALYALDPQDGAISTIQMRVQDRGPTLKIGRRQPLDTCAMQGLQEVIARVAALNHDLWHLIRRHNFPV